MRAQASPQCGPGSISAWPGVWVELVFGSRLAPAEILSSGTPVSLPTETQQAFISILLISNVMWCNVTNERTNISVLFTLLFFAVGSDVSIQGADGSRYQSIYELTDPSQAMMTDDVSNEDWPQRLLHSE